MNLYVTCSSCRPLIDKILLPQVSEEKPGCPAEQEVPGVVATEESRACSSVRFQCKRASKPQGLSAALHQLQGGEPEAHKWAADLALPLTSSSVNLSELPGKDSFGKNECIPLTGTLGSLRECTEVD